MKVMVTGATGFVGHHVVTQFLAEGHEVVAVARDEARLSQLTAATGAKAVACDVYREPQTLFGQADRPDVFVHLAWPGLPNFQKSFHLTDNLPAEIHLFQQLVDWGVSHFQVAGSCLEYGLQSGPLEEDGPTFPTTPYGAAKDFLRKTLQLIQAEKPFVLQWMRLFYMYGEGQSERSLLSQLDRAIDDGDPVFNMSEGSQLRDYLPITEIARRFALLASRPDVEGVINCCSGQPVSVIDLVRSVVEQRGSTIELNRGYYGRPDYEAMAFWGVPGRISAVL